MDEHEKLKPMSWLKIILILIAAVLVTGILFGILDKFFNLPAIFMSVGLPAVDGALAAFLVVRRQSAITQQHKI